MVTLLRINCEFFAHFFISVEMHFVGFPLCGFSQSARCYGGIAQIGKVLIDELDYLSIVYIEPTLLFQKYVNCHMVDVISRFALIFYECIYQPLCPPVSEYKSCQNILSICVLFKDIVYKCIIF